MKNINVLIISFVRSILIAGLLGYALLDLWKVYMDSPLVWNDPAGECYQAVDKFFRSMSCDEAVATTHLIMGRR